MELHFVSGSLDQLAENAACLIVVCDQQGQCFNGSESIEAAIKPFVETGELGKASGGDLYLINPDGVKANRLLVISVGEKIKKAHDLRKATAKAWKIARSKGLSEVTIDLAGFGEEAHQRAAAEGLFLGSYTYTELKTEKDKLPGSLAKVTFVGGDETAVQAWYGACQGTALSRDLSQAPPNIVNPTTIAEKALAMAEEKGLKAHVIGEDQLTEMGMNVLLSVSQGSQQPGQLIVMEYEPAKPSGKTVVLVGKAVTFDSGGLSLKPSNAMAEMKGDMGGGAAVIGTMSALKDTNCPHRVIGLVPAVENMPSGTATRPSDVYTSLSGITVEVNNTDAEGRLILADALTYADEFKPDFVVDFATLTGACLVALGPSVCAVMGNHEPLTEAILEAGKETHELFWELPLVDEYKSMLKSNVADISNISSSRWGGTITAGLFLERFAGKYQWAHCDIAAAIFDKGDDLHPAGGTGIGVRMALQMLHKL
jgi:leucyl aminopeptidase